MLYIWSSPKFCLFVKGKETYPSSIPKQALIFKCLQYKPFENTARKGEIAHNEQFLLFSQCFLPV